MDLLVEEWFIVSSSASSRFVETWLEEVYSHNISEYFLKNGIKKAVIHDMGFAVLAFSFYWGKMGVLWYGLQENELEEENSKSIFC